jgi:hypothetical protein
MCGTSGDDVLNGFGGNDELRGFAGRDTLAGLSGDDRVDGGPDADSVDGGRGDDVVIGGFGRDTFEGGPGNDRLFGRDGHLEANYFCSDGTDSADMDVVDAGRFFSSSLFLFKGCEDITAGAVNEGPNVVISGRSRRVGRDGRTRIRLRCPASLRQPSRCRGRLKLQLRSRGFLRRNAPRTRYSIPPGQSRSIRVRLSRRDRRTLRRRRRARGVATSVEAGQHGRKTTAKTLRMRARG